MAGSPHIKHGHPEFYKLLDSMASLHDRKNRDYAMGGKPTGNFDRVGKILELYPNIDVSDPQMVAVFYFLKQFDAFMWMSSQGHPSVTGEGKLERLMDMAIYTGIMYCQERDKLDAERDSHVESTSVEYNTLRDDIDRLPPVPTTEGINRAARDPRTPGDPTRWNRPERTPATLGGTTSGVERSPRECEDRRGRPTTLGGIQPAASEDCLRNDERSRVNPDRNR